MERTRDWHLPSLMQLPNLHSLSSLLKPKASKAQFFFFSPRQNMHNGACMLRNLCHLRKACQTRLRESCCLLSFGLTRKGLFACSLGPRITQNQVTISQQGDQDMEPRLRKPGMCCSVIFKHHIRTVSFPIFVVDWV